MYRPAFSSLSPFDMVSHFRREIPWLHANSCCPLIDPACTTAGHMKISDLEKDLWNYH